MKIIFLVIGVAAALGCSPSDQPQDTAAWAGPQPIEDRKASVPFRTSTVANNLTHPWAVAFLPNHDILITELGGTMRLVSYHTGSVQSIAGLPDIQLEREGGLLDVAVDRQFERNQFIYLSYRKQDQKDPRLSTTAVLRARLEGSRLLELQDLLTADAWRRSGFHYGGRLLLDPQGYLFVTIGDRRLTTAFGEASLEDSGAPQNLGTHIGKTLRIHVDGRVPNDNPFRSSPGALPEIWTYGHLNSQGLATAADGSTMWQVEHGPQGGDELNLLFRGDNYGWPLASYGIPYGGELRGMASSPHRSDVRDSVYYWNPSVAPSSLMFYSGLRFEPWAGSLFVGALAGGYLSRLTLRDQVVVSEERLLSGRGRVRDVEQGLDGLIYVLVDRRDESHGGALLRLRPLSEEPVPTRQPR